jgi:hypothetical protein
MQGRWLLGVGLVAGLAGCGLGVSGFDFDHPKPDAGADLDTGTRSEAGLGLDSGGLAADSAPVTVESGPPPSCTSMIPSGWSLTVYETTQATCPAGATASHDGVAGGDAGAGACSCACAASGAVSCTTGTLQLTGGTASTTCGGATTSVAVDAEFCAPLTTAMPLSAYMSAAPLTPSGACTSTLSSDPTKLTKNAVRWCDVAGTGAEAACGGTAPTGFSACIAHAGAVACPAGSDFTARTVVSDDVELSCAACSSCAPGGSCGGGLVSFFSDGNCNDSIIAIDADGKCNLTGVATASVGSVLYDANVASTGSCQPGSSAAGVTPTGSSTTLCCR